MPAQSEGADKISTAGEERSKRQERAYRILDAAAELIQRWGYKKTTIDDIARVSGVPKGTIYLHWKTREDLFMALLLRESVEASIAMFERIANDPEGLLLSNLTRHTISVIMTRPLAKALFIRDVEVLGELVRGGQEDIWLISQQKTLASRVMFEMFRSKGMLRTDQSIAIQMKMYNAIFIGFMTINQYVPVELQLSPEETVETLAEVVRYTLEPGEPVSAQVLQEVRIAWEQFAQQVMQLLRERLQKEIEL